MLLENLNVESYVIIVVASIATRKQNSYINYVFMFFLMISMFPRDLLLLLLLLVILILFALLILNKDLAKNNTFQ